MYLILLNSALKNYYDGKFYTTYISPQFKKNELFITVQHGQLTIQQSWTLITPPPTRDERFGHLVRRGEHEGRTVPPPRGNSAVPVGNLSMRAAMDNHYDTWFSSVCTHFVLLCL